MAHSATITSALRPVQVLVTSFVLMILVGTVVLMLPECHAPGHEIGFLDALFTSTSAVCVTGLIVVDTATAWTRVGQVVILILLQLGGIGIVTFGALFALLLGQKISWRQRALLKEQYGQATFINILSIIPIVAGVTLVIELLGAALLLPVFVPQYGTADGIWHSAFQAVSAFCNAGFSTFSDSLEQYVGNYLVNAVIGILIIIGGLGFPVLAELMDRRGRRKRLSLHSRVVLWSSSVLIIVGAILLFFIQTGYDPDFNNMPIHSRILASLFQSVTARTAGFNTVRIGMIAPASLMMLQFLMIIGGSPSGTAGGIKTTTFVASLAAIRSVLVGQTDTKILDRRLARDVAKRALVLVVLAVLIIAIAVICLLLTGWESSIEGKLDYFLQLSFEAVSAFGTVGLSTGITPDLTAGQRIVIIFLMLIGRLGPMTFAVALASPRVEQVKFPETNLLTG